MSAVSRPPSLVAAAAPVRLEAGAACDLALALRHEWLVANGRGGYASGTVVGIDTRRYHGLLFAALRPPGGRTLLLARVHEELIVAGESLNLATAEFHDGTLAPTGHCALAAFQLLGTVPCWLYRFADCELEKLVWMEHGANVTHVRYRLTKATAPVRLDLRAFVTHRGHHEHTRGHPDWHPELEARGDACVVRMYPGATPLALIVPRGQFLEQRWWYWRFLHRAERARGFDAEEDLYTPGLFAVELAPGESVTLIASAGPAPWDGDPEAALEREWERQAALVRRLGRGANAVARRLALAADQFVVGPSGGSASGHTIIAGYHWFGAWGRDALVALPGLCLATGRWAEARDVLRDWSGHLQQGLLPSALDEDGVPVYTAADTALWFVEALAHYERVSGDAATVDALLPTVDESVAWYFRGSEHGIRLGGDGLLAVGAPGQPLTWMDARVGDWPVTPRGGKPVELQALWYNALRLLFGWRRSRGLACGELAAAADRCRASFAARFWHAQGGYCYDVVDGEHGDDPSLRPNQLLALALTHPLLAGEQAAGVVAAVERALVTPYGLRTLTPEHPAYRGRYEGDATARESACHQGQVWPWLLWPYAAAARRVYGPGWQPGALLARLVGHLGEAGLGTVSELFDGDPPHAPGGAIAQAWSVGALLRLWLDV